MQTYQNEKDFELRKELLNLAETYLKTEEFDLSVHGPKKDPKQCSIHIDFPYSTSKVKGISFSKRTISIEIKDEFKPAHNVGGINFAANKEIANNGFIEKNENIFINLYLVPEFNTNVIKTIEKHFDELIQNTGMIGNISTKEKVRNVIHSQMDIFKEVLELGNYQYYK
jgi:hypothetical protein